MKKKIQKYLSGEREGFSLVELIIVIAIMAILIGVVALAVIPYLEQSRVSKDQQTVDSVYGAFQSAIADQQITEAQKVTVTIGKVKGEAKIDGTADADFINFMAKALNATDGSDIGKGTAAKLVSSDVKEGGVVCKYDAGTIVVYAVNDQGELPKNGSGEIATAATDKYIYSSNKGSSVISDTATSGLFKNETLPGGE